MTRSLVKRLNLGAVDIGRENQMTQSGRIPLWIVATVAGTGVLVVVGLFFYGAYVGVGSAI